MDFSFFKGPASLTLLFSAIFWQNKNISWLIRKGITCSVEKTPYFYLYFTFLSPKEDFNENPTFLGETLQKHEKGP